VFNQTQSDGKGLPWITPWNDRCALGMNRPGSSAAWKIRQHQRVNEDWWMAAVGIFRHPTTLIRNNRTGATEMIVGRSRRALIRDRARSRRPQ